jgi:hypothetical protein
MVLVAPEPAIAPGLIVQAPAGNPARSTLPVATAQVGSVIELIAGAAGVTGCGLITTLAVADEVQPTELVTV